MEIINAKITSTFLGREDHGIFTFYLGCDTDGSYRSVGGYCLDYKDRDLNKNIYNQKSMALISEIISVVGCNSWEEIKGNYIRLKINGMKVEAIGNIVKDRWVDFSKILSKEEV